MILAVHMPAAVTIPLALVVAGWIMWYWHRLAAPEVPESRRRIRRASLIVMLVSQPILVQALSFTNPHDTNPTVYVIAWLLVIFLVGLVLVTAGLDVLNTMRLQREQRRDRVIQAAVTLAEAAKTARQAKSVQGGHEDDDP